MTTPRSFRQPFGGLSAHYRTPSPPPREAIEPLSPPPDAAAEYHHPSWLPTHNPQNTAGLGLFLDTLISSQREASTGQELWVDGNGQARIDSFKASPKTYNATRNTIYDDERVASRKEGSHKRDRKGHSRARSNMDALATIALATSPTFSQGSPSYQQAPWLSYSNRNGIQPDYEIDGRPSKRARSEHLPSPQLNRKQSRPATSHVSFDTMKDDAELLLNLAQQHKSTSFPKFTSPQRSHFEQESPSYKRLSTSTTESEIVRAATNDTGQRFGLVPEAPNGEGALSMKMEQDGHGPMFEALEQSGESIQTKAFQNHDVDSLGYLFWEPPSDGHFTSTSVGLLGSISHRGSKNDEKKPRRVQPTNQAPCPICKSVHAPGVNESHNKLDSWLQCTGCHRWYHILCAGFKDDRGTRDVDKYICPDCEPVMGPTTWVRKSLRAKTSIDYAGLNQGMIQSPEESAEHHWLKPIKDGRIKFLPDDFARIRPELLTTEYLEKTDGIKRPLVIPACWNPQFGLDLSDDPDAAGSGGDDDALYVVDSEGNEHSPDRFGAGPGDRREVFDYGQDLMDMVMPRHLTVRRVAELHGADMPLDVIDVKSQQTAQKWNLKKWVDYYESPGDKTIRNVISLEVSQSKLGRLLQRPKIVRDLDLQDAVWPLDMSTKAVQFYCLMSVADCYTDFHIDFGGSSVYYHILKGKKTFFFIPPDEKHLKRYEQWNNSPLQNQTFLGNETGDCRRVDLSEG
jgi:F-box and leucine-rich repeat protein 10/11